VLQDLVSIVRSIREDATNCECKCSTFGACSKLFSERFAWLLLATRNASRKNQLLCLRTSTRRFYNFFPFRGELPLHHSHAQLTQAQR
jgi:hypothetical protein